jgi:signal transduction histidine kinase
LKTFVLMVIRLLPRLAFFLVGYLVLHWATFVFVLPDFRVTPWNLETGLSFLVAYLWGPVAWPALLVANVAGEYATGTLSDIRAILLRSTLYASAYAGFGFMLSWWSAGDRHGSLPQVVKFLLLSAVAASLFGSLLVLGISWLSRIPSPRIISAIVTSATGDMIGILSVVPLYFAWAAARSSGVIPRRHYLKALVAVFAIGVACFVVFGLDSTDQFKFFYLILLPVVAISLIYGFIGAALSVFASDLMMMLIIDARDVAPATATELQILMITLSATGLLLGSVVSDRARLSSELVESHKRLSEAQARLLHGSRVMLINEMASAIAHEINQPLSAIRNFCRAIQRLITNPEADRERLSSLVVAAVEQVDAASEIINDTRRFVKRDVPGAANASVNDCISICFRLLQQDVDRSMVKLRARAAPNLYVRIPPLKLQQVLLNLLRNSIEAIVNGSGSIAVTAHRLGGGQIRIEVVDTGIGIPDKIRADLFTPFVTTKEHGLGLGLSLARTIVADHGGELWCENSTPGHTTVCFTLRETLN